MRAKRCLRRLTAAGVVLLWTTAALAGFTQPVVTPNPSPLSFPGEEVGKTSPAHTETYSVAGGSGGSAVQINSISASGDFAIVPGGTCATGIGNAVFSPGACTVFVTFTPTAVGARSGTLTFNCTSISVPGGGAVTCGLTSSDILVPLLGSGFTLSIVGVPTLSSLALALLSCTLILATFLTLRRRRP